MQGKKLVYVNNTFLPAMCRKSRKESVIFGTLYWMEGTEATQMEGFGRVRDGSKKAENKNPVIGNGYYWLNAVMGDG